VLYVTKNTDFFEIFGAKLSTVGMSDTSPAGEHSVVPLNRSRRLKATPVTDSR
jgi:hypothetical protein